jgi:hypothetical protein
LQVFPDRLGGEWFACSSCKEVGDGVELAAKIWNLDIPDTIKKLSRSGFELPTDGKSIKCYIEYYVKQRDRVRALWRQSRQDHFHDNTHLRGLVHELRLHSELTREQWDAGPGHLIGGNTRRQIQKTFYPRAKKPSHQTRVFAGRVEGKVALMLPFWELPGRISGFYLICAHNDPNAAFFRCVRYHPGNKLREEAGLYLHPDALDIARRFWNNTVVALKDVLVAAQLHARHFEHSRLPLPLVAWHNQAAAVNSKIKTQTAWQMLRGQQPVFWMPKLDPQTLEQAAATNGLISLVGPTKCSPKSLKTYIWHYQPRDLLQHIINTAKPWVDVFTSAVAELSDGVVENLAKKLIDEGTNTTQLLSQLPASPRERLRKILSKARSLTRISRGRDQIIEQGGQWYVRTYANSAEENILTGVLRIDHVIHHEKAGESFLEGRLIVNGQVIPFCEAEKTVEKNTLGWLEDLAKNKGKTLVNGKKRWSIHLLEIAKEIHPPTYVAGIESVGWDTEHARFVLPNYNIKLGGKLEPALPDLAARNAPGLSLSRPTRLVPEDLEPALKDSERSSLFWAVFAPLVANITAPAFARNPSGIVLTCNGATWVAKDLCQAIGCEVATMPARVQYNVERFYAKEFEHGWPVFIGDHTHVGLDKWRGYWLSLQYQGYRNCVVSLDRAAAMLRASHPGWHVVVGDSVANVPVAWRTLAAKLLPAYLRDLARRNCKLRLESPRDTWLEEILHDLAAFVSEIGANPGKVYAAQQRLWPSTEHGHAKAFIHFLACLLRSSARSGRGNQAMLTVVPEGFTERNKYSLVILDNGVLVPKMLGDWLLMKNYQLPEEEQISKMLHVGGILVEERDDGWVIDNATWRKAHEPKQHLLPY